MDSPWDQEHWGALIMPAATSYATPSDQPAQPQAQLHAMLPPARRHVEARKYTTEDWNTQRPEIARLYKDNILERVIELMRERHGLTATAKQYKDRIKRWNLNKNIQPDEMEAVIRKQRQRALESNKLSAFRVRKRPVNPEKIIRYIKEHPEPHLPSEDVDWSMDSAATPAAISCYTPSDTGPPSPPPNLSPQTTPSPQTGLNPPHILPLFSDQGLYSGSCRFSDPIPTLSRAPSVTPMNGNSYRWPLLPDENVSTGQSPTSFSAEPNPHRIDYSVSQDRGMGVMFDDGDHLTESQTDDPFNHYLLHSLSFPIRTPDSIDEYGIWAVTEDGFDRNSRNYNEQWPSQYEQKPDIRNNDNEDSYRETVSACHCPVPDALPLARDSHFGDDVEEIVRTEPPMNATPSENYVHLRSRRPHLAMIAPSPIASPLLEFTAPVFIEFTEKKNRRALVDHFCNVLSHLIVFKDFIGNPFRQLVLPLSHASSPVMNAILALSSAHLEYRGIENDEKSLHFHNKALQGLAMLIEQNEQANKEEVLGAIMLLVYYEVLVRRDGSNIVSGHLKGAMIIMKSGPQIPTPTLLFLERTFRFFDVIVPLSLGTAPNMSTQPTSTPFPLPSPPGYIDSPLNAVDTLLGLSTQLWPIIHRLSHLLSHKTSIKAALAAGQTSIATALQAELKNTSQAIELTLTNWSPTTRPKASPSENEGDEFPKPLAEDRAEGSCIEGILNNAEAYRHSAFIYLYRTIRCLPRSHYLIQKHAYLSLRACAKAVETTQGPLWPLFVAACEAVTDDDRMSAMRAFRRMERRQGMDNIARAWEVVQEVWRRVDFAGEEVEVNWRDICVERGFDIILG